MGSKRLLCAFLSLAILLLTAVPAGAQSGGRITPPIEHLQVSALPANAVADSISAPRADSLLGESAARVLADSLQHNQDLLEAVRRAHWIEFHKLRKVPNEAFGLGERLVFDVSYGIITAGQAVMSIAALDTISGRPCYRVEFTVHSLPSFSWIYRVDDHYLTYIDMEAIVPWKFEQHIREGTYRRDFIADFDQIHHVARTTEGEHRIPPYVHDIMSAFYYARTLDFSNSNVGDIVSLHNFFKDTTYELGVKFLGRQELEVKAGTFRTIVIEPLVKEGGLFKNEGRIVIWLTDDDRKIPVRVNTKVIIGSIDTELYEYSGLTGPVQARIK